VSPGCLVSIWRIRNGISRRCEFRGKYYSSSIVLVAIFLLGPFCAATTAAPTEPGLEAMLTGKFHWTVGPPVLVAALRSEDPCYSVKDPSIVYYQNRWHLFCTIRSQKRSHQIEYLSFSNWSDAATAPRHILGISDGYFCAPQVFYFTPHRKWYLICQINEPSRTPSLQPAFSTSADIADPASWTKPTLLFSSHPENVTAWIDFWVICDGSKAHLFFTSNNGLMWRAETSFSDFPSGWTKPEVVLKEDIFEASHTYRLKGRNQFLTLIEAQNGNRRYYKAYVAERLDGRWQPVASTKDQPLASPINVRDTDTHWADSFSHGELLRSGYDEHLEVDPAHFRFLFQGVTDDQMAGKKYGEIPWRLGILEDQR
jgi:Glycosyl hydrolase family 62